MAGHEVDVVAVDAHAPRAAWHRVDGRAIVFDLHRRQAGREGADVVGVGDLDAREKPDADRVAVLEDA